MQHKEGALQSPGMQIGFPWPGFVHGSGMHGVGVGQTGAGFGGHTGVGAGGHTEPDFKQITLFGLLTTAKGVTSPAADPITISILSLFHPATAALATPLAFRALITVGTSLA